MAGLIRLTIRRPLWTRRRLLYALHGAAALALIAAALAPPVHELGEHNVRIHHLQHAALLGGGGMLGLLLGRWVRRAGWQELWVRWPQWRAPALGVVLLGPLIVMLLMAPSTSSWTIAHPVAHVLEHLLLIDLGGLIGFSATLFAPTLGWLTVLLLVAMAAAFGGMARAQPPGPPRAGAVSGRHPPGRSVPRASMRISVQHPDNRSRDVIDT
jgi:hypothetical protein